MRLCHPGPMNDDTAVEAELDDDLDDVTSPVDDYPVDEYRLSTRRPVVSDGS
jgi:hypothetical protein